MSWGTSMVRFPTICNGKFWNQTRTLIRVPLAKTHCFQLCWPITSRPIAILLRMQLFSWLRDVGIASRSIDLWCHIVEILQKALLQPFSFVDSSCIIGIVISVFGLYFRPQCIMAKTTGNRSSAFVLVDTWFVRGLYLLLSWRAGLLQRVIGAVRSIY